MTKSQFKDQTKHAKQKILDALPDGFDIAAVMIALAEVQILMAELLPEKIGDDE